MKRRLPQAAKNPKCGTCTACCTVLGVRELDKPPNVTCQHLNGRCGIYAQRPTSCREYECLWLQGAIRADARPDRCGLIFEAHRERGDTILVREVDAGAVERNHSLLSDLDDRFVLIIARVDGTRVLRGPTHLVAKAVVESVD